jgi:hypothetical protein
MKTFTTTTLLALIATLAAAAPAPQDYNGFRAQITFIGAADAQFTESVLADGSKFYISMLLPQLSFDSIDTNYNT